MSTESFFFGGGFRADVCSLREGFLLIRRVSNLRQTRGWLPLFEARGRVSAQRDSVAKDFRDVIFVTAVAACALCSVGLTTHARHEALLYAFG